ncbi:hypothetical protein L1887_31769 [Cichorium endivia]|nr:hypothetical protein L1887_31769 [Cichorium endivia]
MNKSLAKKKVTLVKKVAITLDEPQQKKATVLISESTNIINFPIDTVQNMSEAILRISGFLEKTPLDVRVMACQKIRNSCPNQFITTPQTNVPPHSSHAALVKENGKSKTTEEDDLIQNIIWTKSEDESD